MEVNEQLVIDDEVLQLLGINQADVLQRRTDYDNMKVKDIIMYKKKFKKQQKQIYDNKQLRGDEDSESDDDDDGDNDDVASTSTRGSHSRQLAGSKRKRKQSASEKAAKRQSEKERK
ncbi:hypothetical protein DFQ28_000270 [Apophysomyces sp. BC1034]|nr:hypothetical protein DFQ29_005143 [Apophysomyces sp. BC1021]KAG0191384.1 hypothetical protein DFQ28_000270 [Apophysomyces sp. BC1034]